MTTVTPSAVLDDRAAYAAVLAASPQRTIFAQAWWLDAATGAASGWIPVVVRAPDGAPRAAWPLVLHGAGTAARVGTGAPYTPFLGPLLPAAEDGPNRVSSDVRATEELAAAVADWAHVEAACAPEFDYWTPLAWHGFAQTTRTTWRIAAGQSADAVRSAMRKGTRSALTAAERDGLTVGPATVEELLDACAGTFSRQAGAAVPNRAALQRVATAALNAGHGEILGVRTPDGRLASAGLFVYDDRWTWNLANGRPAGIDATGAPTLLVWHAILGALARGTGFDFEGSMLRPVEQFVRGFGGTPVPYSVVTRSTPAWRRRVARRRTLKRLLRR